MCHVQGPDVVSQFIKNCTSFSVFLDTVTYGHGVFAKICVLSNFICIATVSILYGEW